MTEPKEKTTSAKRRAARKKKERIVYEIQPDNVRAVLKSTPQGSQLSTQKSSEGDIEDGKVTE